MAPARERRVPKRYSDESFQRGFYSERGQKEKPTTANFHPVAVTAVDKVAKRVKTHLGIFLCDTCSFSLCRRALPQVSVAW